MNILICTYSITRTAGGVFDAVKDLFTNKTFHKHNLKIISFSDKHIDEDISSFFDSKKFSILTNSFFIISILAT